MDILLVDTHRSDVLSFWSVRGGHFEDDILVAMEMSGAKLVLFAIQVDWLLVFFSKDSLNVTPSRKRGDGLGLALQTRLHDFEATSLIVIEEGINGKVRVQNKLSHNVKLSIKKNVQAKSEVVIKIIRVLIAL